MALSLESGLEECWFKKGCISVCLRGQETDEKSPQKAKRSYAFFYVPSDDLMFHLYDTLYSFFKIQ